MNLIEELQKAIRDEDASRLSDLAPQAEGEIAAFEAIGQKNYPAHLKALVSTLKTLAALQSAPSQQEAEPMGEARRRILELNSLQEG